MTGRRTGSGGERGAVTILVLACVGALLTVTLGGLGWAGALAARQRAESAADLAALAGAMASHRGRDGCAVAAHVVAANAAQGARDAPPLLVSCRLAGSSDELTIEVEIEVPVEVLGLELAPARARARAGDVR